MQCNFLTDILDLVYLRFAQNAQREHSIHTGNCSILGCWNPLEKLAEMFLNTFHCIRFSKTDTVKSYGEKIVLKTLQLEFNPMWEIILFIMILMWLITLYCKWILPAYILDMSIKI